MRVDYYLDLNREHHKGGNHKQILRNTDIHDYLLDEGFDLSYSSVCTYIRKQTLKNRIKEAYIRQSYIPGQDCEFDWGVLKLIIAGKETSLHLAIERLCHIKDGSWDAYVIGYIRDTLKIKSRVNPYLAEYDKYLYSRAKSREERRSNCKQITTFGLKSRIDKNRTKTAG